MFRIVLGFFMKVGAAATPLLVPMFVGLGIERVDEKQAGAVISVALLTAIFGFEVFEHAVPRFHARRFCDEYLGDLVKNHFASSSEHLRFNVMLAERKWYTLWLFRTFTWVASRGFKRGHHHDSRLLLGEWQGVCGKALRREKAVFADFRGLPKSPPHWLPWRNPFRLFRRQVLRTRDVLVIGSVPLIVKRGSPGAPRFQAVGVLNVDAVSKQGAEWLVANWPSLKDPLIDVGGYLAALLA